MALTDADIETLISCPKTITRGPRHTRRLESGSYRDDLDLTSTSGDMYFTVFMRQNEAIQEDFSIGLRYEPRDGSGAITLLRYNGPHGPHAQIQFAPHMHFRYHVHHATAAAIDAGGRPEKEATVSTEYASYEQALDRFLERINAVDRDEHFRRGQQLGLWPFSK